MTQCPRCQSEGRKCLNHQRAAELKAKLAHDDHREALARGNARYERNTTTGRGM